MRPLGPIAPDAEFRKEVRLSRDYYVRVYSNDYSRGSVRDRAAGAGHLVPGYGHSGPRCWALHEPRWARHQIFTDSAHVSRAVVLEKGRGTYRQGHPKTKACFRTVKLPPFAFKRLARRQATEHPKPEDMLFPSSSGTVRSPTTFAGSGGTPAQVQALNG
ncbi:hypothetical protein [Arthrobacter sp. STN4]|uniref:Mu transposase domain-containing protein n=1 Tax=Arthrobacter sp. STN4 TaxID=2923276 RepID=UPI0035C1FECA